MVECLLRCEEEMAAVELRPEIHYCAQCSPPELSCLDTNLSQV